jgi:putative flippase GtrA
MTAAFLTRPFTLRRDTIRQAASFGAIGVVSTVAYVALFASLRPAMSTGLANALALLATAVGNTAANRRVTFEVRGRGSLARDHAAGLLALGVALAITTASVAAMDVFVPQRTRLGEVAILVGANATATLFRFLLLRAALDRRGGYQPSSATVATLSTPERIAT